MMCAGAATSTNSVCNACNLGLMLQRCPWLGDSKVNDGIEESISWIVDRFRYPDYYGMNLKYSAKKKPKDRHERCSLSESLYIWLEGSRDLLQGLTLEPLVSKK